MALILADRVQETTTTTGTGTITLGGAVTGFQSFAAIGNGNTTYYTIAGGSEWEVGIGTYTSAGTTLSRTTVLASSNSGSLVSFSAGTKNVFVTYPSKLTSVVVQTVSASYSTSVTTSSATFADTGLTATITPKFATSKILIIISQPAFVQRAANGGVRLSLQILRNGSSINSTIGALGGQAAQGNGGITNFVGTISMNYLDSPATVSAVTYKTQSAIQFAEASYNGTTSLNSEPAVITLMEITA